MSDIKGSAWPPAHLTAGSPEYGRVPAATAAILRIDAARRPAEVRSVSSVMATRDYSSQPIEWIVDNLIAAGTVTMLAGDSGSGKTTLATAIGHAVAHGRPLAGLQTATRPVLMLDRENPLVVVRERLERLGIEDGERFIIWGGWVEGQVPAAASPIVTEWVQQCDPKPLVIVDSLVSYLEGSENDSTAIRENMDGYRALANLGATVLLLHHTGKAESSKDYRGSSDIKASVDVAFNLANLGDPSRLSMLRLRAFKSRFAAEAELILNYRDGEFSASVQEPRATTHDILVALLKANPGITTREFETLVIDKNINRGRARDFISAGSESGRIRVRKGDRNRTTYTWAGEDTEVSVDLF